MLHAPSLAPESARLVHPENTLNIPVPLTRTHVKIVKQENTCQQQAASLRQIASRVARAHTRQRQALLTTARVFCAVKENTLIQQEQVCAMSALQGHSLRCWAYYRFQNAQIVLQGLTQRSEGRVPWLHV